MTHNSINNLQINDHVPFRVNGYILLFSIIYVFGLGIVLFLKPNYFIYLGVLIPLLPILIFILLEKLEFSFLLYIAATPIIQHLSTVSIAMGDFRLTPDIVLHLIFLVAVANDFLYSYSPRKFHPLNTLDKLLLLFVLLSVFSLITASDLPINHAKRFLLYYSGIFQTITFFFMVLYFLNKIPGFTKKLILALTLTSISAALVALIEIRMIGLDLIKLYIYRNQIGFGYHNTNLFGMQVALVFPISIFTLNSMEFQKYRILVWCNFILLSILAILTLNRGTFVVLAFYLFILFFNKENRKIVYAFLISGAIGAIYFNKILYIYIYRFISSSANSSKFLADESALYRLEVWGVGIRTLLERPLGVGGNGFQYMWQKIGPHPLVYFGTPHQLLLYIGVDYGLPALLIFIFLIAVIIFYTDCLSKAKDLYNYKLFYYIKLSLFGYLIHGFLTGGELSHLSGNMFPNNGYSYVLMVILALVSFHYGKSGELKS